MRECVHYYERLAHLATRHGSVSIAIVSMAIVSVAILSIAHLAPSHGPLLDLDPHVARELHHDALGAGGQDRRRVGRHKRACE